MTAPENGAGGTPEDAPTTKTRNPTVARVAPDDKTEQGFNEVDARVGAAGVLASHALLGDIDQQVALAGIVVLLERARHWLRAGCP